MSFNAEGYQVAALERLESSAKLYTVGDYVMCHYAAGLAVECMLRAYRFRRNPEFDARHDLYDLYRISGVDAVTPEKQRYAANASLAIVMLFGPMIIASGVWPICGDSYVARACMWGLRATM